MATTTLPSVPPGAPSSAQPVAQAASLPERPEVRRTSLSAVLRLLHTGGPRSRAQLAGETGLNKATVSSVVAELLAAGLVREQDVQRGGLGRPGQAVAVDGRGAAGIGVQVDIGDLTAEVLDLEGVEVWHRRVTLPTARLAADLVLDRVAELVREAEAAARDAGRRTVGATVALPGGVDPRSGVLEFAPNLGRSDGWRHAHVAESLGQRLLGSDPTTHAAGRVDIRVDNEANLAALGERAARGPAAPADLLLLTGGVGVGSGIVAGGRVVRGAHGFAGEVGHMPVAPDDVGCGCGRRGCWETVVGLPALLRAAADTDDPVHDPALDLEERLELLVRRAEDGDARTLAALARMGSWLGLGAAVLVNVLDPEVLVLGGYFAAVGPWVVDPVRQALAHRVVATPDGACRVEVSGLGVHAARYGAAWSALEAVVDDPTLVTSLSAPPPVAPGTRGGRR